MMGLKIQKNGNLTYILSNFKLFAPKLLQPVTPLPLPEDTARNNILTKFEGNTLGFDLAWTLIFEEETVVEERTGANAITTPIQQMLFLVTDFEFKSIEDYYELFVEENGTEESFQGVISEINFQKTGDAPVTYEASCKFYVGKVIIHAGDTDEDDNG